MSEVTLFWKRVFADRMKLRVLNEIILHLTWALHLMTSVLQETRGERDKEEEKPCQDKGRGWSDAAITQDRLEPPEAVGAGRMLP